MHIALHIAKRLLCVLKDTGVTEVEDVATQPEVSQRSLMTEPGVLNLGLCFQPLYNCIHY